MTDLSDNLRALVVEDTPEMAAQLKRILEKRFTIEADIAPDCATARSKLAGGGYHLVTLDFMLPDGRGLEILEEITARGELPRVIMITGHGDEESAVRSFRSAASGYVIKDAHLAARLAESVEKAITEMRLKEAQDELASREAHFRTLTDQSSDIVAVLGSDGMIQYQSRSIERFLGYTPDELIGRDVFELIHPDDVKRTRTQLDDALETPGDVVVMEYRVRHKDGDWHYLESVGRNLVFDPAVSGIVLNSRDVSRRKLAERELDKYRRRLENLVQERTAELAETNVRLREEIGERMQAVEELKERAESLANFLTVASHELRHPISVVKGYTTMLQGYLQRMEPEMLPEILDALGIAVDRLTGHVDELLQASLVEEGRFTFDKSMTDLAPLIDEAVMDRRGLEEANQISVVIGPGAGTALADPGKIKQLLDILLDNAIKFAEPDSPVDIEVAKDGRVTTVRVLDRGIGIPIDAREQVFDRFFQVEELQHHSSVGLGLGLYLALEITSAHGGSIWTEPRPGGGTIFSFEITDDA